MSRILVVDDDTQSLESTRKILDVHGFEVHTAKDGREALDLLRASQREVDLVLTDVRMPRVGGLELLRVLSIGEESVPVILMTAFGRIEDAVWAMKLGAVDFLTKPFKRTALISAVENALKRRTVRAAKSPVSVHDLIGNSPEMIRLREQIRQVGPTTANILLRGESGTGKELVARQIHSQGPRASESFIAVNCAAIPEQLIESELFGHEKGSFTGATALKIGLFEAADGGTLLLDEIGDMPLLLQSKLLRVLQEGEIRRIGASASRKVDVRVIAATHRDLDADVAAGRFRQDLLFRLEVITIGLPPLRERTSDLDELAGHFLREHSRRHSKQIDSISPAAMALLRTHSWPGNVRELSNLIERAVVFSKGGEVRVEDLPDHLRSGETRAGSASISIPLGTSLKQVEDLLIRKTLEATSGDKNMTAKLLGINSRTIYRKLGSSGTASSPNSDES